MPQTPLRWPLAAALILLGGCGQDALLDKIAGDEDGKAAAECIDMLRAGKLDELDARLDPSLRNDETRASLRQMYDVLPKEEPTARRLIGANYTRNQGGAIANLTYEYAWSGRYFLINCAIRTQDAERFIFGLGVHSQDASIEERMMFDLAGKSARHYAVLFALIAALALTLVALIRCVREPDLRRKWLWVLFIIFGVGQFSLHWNSGGWVFEPLHLQLFSAGTETHAAEGWYLIVALPLGAIVYLVRRFRNPGAARRSNTA